MANFTEFKADFSSRKMTLDLTPCFPDTMDSVFRTFEIEENKEVTIRDKWSGKAKFETLVWRMFTSTEVAVNGSSAILSSEGKKLVMEITKPENTVFTTRPATDMLNELDAPLPGVQVLEIILKEPSGVLEVVLMNTKSTASSQ